MKQLITAVLFFVCFISSAQFCSHVEQGIEYSWSGSVASFGGVSYNYVANDPAIAILNGRFTCTDVSIINLPVGAEFVDVTITPLYGSTPLSRGELRAISVRENYSQLNFGNVGYLLFNNSTIMSNSLNQVNIANVPDSRTAEYRLTQYPNILQREPVLFAGYKVEYTLRIEGELRRYIGRSLIYNRLRIEMDHQYASRQVSSS